MATLTEQITRNLPGGSVRAEGLSWREILLSTLPWTAELAHDELTVMAEELEAAANYWAETGDSRRISQLEEDWRATVDLIHDKKASEHIGRQDRTYIDR